ncbi:T9SS type A sorting domain-containing protein, partial [bacterium]|nr:T9SS type A sorting domain-containing protein [bacterium]
FVGVDQSLKLESVTFHPNPCEDSFVLAFDGSPRCMKIYDNIGKLMLEREVYPGVLIDISLFNSGLYYIHINNEINKLIKL